MADEEEKTKRPKELPVSSEDLAAVTSFINRKAGGQQNDKCPVCESASNQVEPYVFQLPVGYDQNILGINRHAPIYLTTCLNCGFMRLFNKKMVDRLIAAEGNEGGE